MLSFSQTGFGKKSRGLNGELRFVEPKPSDTSRRYLRRPLLYAPSAGAL